jgi:hypothetical protein
MWAWRRGGKTTVLRVFLRVVLENVVRSSGYFVVKLWWMRGKTWCAGWLFSGAKNMPTF